MTETLANAPTDPGLFALEMLLRLQGIDATADELGARVGHGRVGIPEMVACTRQFGLKARSVTVDWERLAGLPLPGVAGLRDGGFLLLGKVIDDRAIVLAPNAARPAVITRSEFEARWDGQVLLVTKPRVPGRFSIGSKVGKSVGVMLRRARRLLRREVARKDKDAAPGTAVAGAVVIDFSERARKIGRAVGLQKLVEDRRRSDELAFLPAALEIVETPPSPLGRAVAFSIIAVFAIGLTWACIGTVDIVAVAPGKIIPSGRTKTVQAFETGVVRAIHVHDGQPVKAGDVLVELDATMNAAELGHVKSDLMAAKLDVARLRAALSGRTDPVAALAPPADAPADLVQMHRRFLVSQTIEQNAKLAAIDRQVAQKTAERATIQAAIDKLKATITPLQQRVEIREHLVQKELGSKLTYLSELQELVGQRQEILVQQSRFTETDAALSALAETRAKTVAEYERGMYDELAKAEQKVAGFTQDVVKGEQRTSLQRLRAPVDGIVQQLAIHTIGGVVTPAQSMMLVVPAESRLEIEAMVSNRDIGFVEAGQEAAVKVDTFNFTRYGLLQGKILSVSQDAITREKPPEKANATPQGSQSASSEPQGQELIYAARISVDRTKMNIDNKLVNLAPGMAVTAEIKTGTRSIISYLMSPIARYQHESLRER